MTAELTAIARGEEDAGAPAFFENELNSKTTNGGSAALTAEMNLLHCLGTAVIMRWDALPAKVQRELFEDARSLDDLRLDIPPQEVAVS
jgi:hypothetical protein